LDPPLVLFCLDRSAFLHSAFRRAESFAINILAAGQENISRHFADRHHHAKPKNMWEPKRKKALLPACPLLRGTLGWIVCRPHAFYKGGDHTIIVGEVVDLHKRATTKEPLAYFHGRYRDLAKETFGARK
jgi:flavin reductase (DIM6/NTAB) family NADH-FMN oxidoreductase RutF